MILRPLASRSTAALASVAFAALSGGAGAQNVPAPAQAPPPAQALPAAPSVPQYQVEVLIFAHRDFDRSEELFRHEHERATPLRAEALRTPPVFDDTNFGPLAQNAPSPLDLTPAPGQPPPSGANAPLPGQDALAADPNEFRFRLLRPDELQLTSQYRTLERNAQAYTPLLHGGWVQPGLPATDARPFDLAMLGARNPMGTIRLYLSRFLHVNVDLSYLDSGAAPLASAPSPGELAELPITPRYHLLADRPTRSGELHYFDHPAFGVLIKVTPVRAELTPSGVPGTRPAA